MSSHSLYIPDAFRETFNALEQEVVHLFFKIRYTEQLFADSENEEVINKPPLTSFVTLAEPCYVTSL